MELEKPETKSELDKRVYALLAALDMLNDTVDNLVRLDDHYINDTPEYLEDAITTTIRNMTTIVCALVKVE